MQIQYRGTITKKDFLKCIIMLNPMKWQKWFFGILLGFIAFSFVYLWIEGATGTFNQFSILDPQV